MKKLLYITSLVIFISCTKEVDPTCGHLYYETKLYNNGVTIEHVTTDFGVICGDEYLKFKDLVSKQTALGEQLCPPERRYGKWIIMNIQY